MNTPALELFPSTSSNWLFILLIPVVAITSGLLVFFLPQYFELVLMLDLWLLGYHHVISTYTRLAFDLQSMREHWFLLIPLPILVILGVITGYQLGGGVLIGSVYLYWQWYHYTRQSEGVSKAFGCKLKDGHRILNHSLNRMAFYAIPSVCFLWMISSGPQQFLGIGFWNIYIPPVLRIALMAIAFGIAAGWVWVMAGYLLKKEISKYYFVYVCSHFIVYIMAYVVIADINYGWLTINIWHNAQYIGFVWLFNRKKYGAGVDTKHLIISYISQPGRLGLYLLGCLALSTVIYVALSGIIENVSVVTGIPVFTLVLLIYSSINFHHYIVDAKIWKLRKPSMQRHLSLQS